MTSKIFKIGFPVLTLMFAITTSLAFTSNSADAPETYYYEETPVLCSGIVIEETECNIFGYIPCTVTILGTPYQLFVDMSQGTCIIPLWAKA